jgi:phosphohistidine phosphatase
MKKLFLLRHGKSSWDYPELDDFERPLNKRGHRDIPVMGKLLNTLEINPDLIITSPAVRAAYTARILAQIINYPEKQIVYHDSIYDASVQTLLNLIHNIDAHINRPLLVGHNPGFTSLINYLTDKKIDNLPTAGLYGMEFSVDNWSEVSERNGGGILFEYPRKHRGK